MRSEDQLAVSSESIGLIYPENIYPSVRRCDDVSESSAIHNTLNITRVPGEQGTDAAQEGNCIKEVSSYATVTFGQS